jgi:O-antigen/teichoic acid export membrane protein
MGVIYRNEGHSMLRKNKLIKNYLYNTIYQVLVLIAPLITTPYVSRILGATGVGIYSYAQSIATYFVLVGAVGTTLYGQREIAYVQSDIKRRTKVFWEIEIFRIAAVSLCTIFYCIAFCLSGEYVSVYRILILEVLATAVDISWFFIGMENFRVIVIRNTIIKVVGIALVFILVKSPSDVPLYAVCITIPTFVGNISLWFNLRKYLSEIHQPARMILRGIRVHVKPILILFIPQVATEVYLVLDKTMIGLLGSNIDQVGYYTQAQKIVKIVLTVVTSLGTVMLPAMSSAFARGETKKIQNNIKLALRFTFMLSFALTFGLIAIASRFVPIFFGKGYDEVIPLMIVIAPILIIIGVSNVLGKQYLLPTMQQTAYTASVVAGAGVNFLLNLILIPYLDAVGASIATIAAELSVTAVQCWCVRKQIPLLKSMFPMVKYCIMGFVMFAVVTVVGNMVGRGVISICVMIITGIAVYVLELILTKDELVNLGWNLIRKDSHLF